MESEKNPTYTAFDGEKILAHGQLEDVALTVRQRLKTSQTASVLVFSDLTGKEMDFDLRGSEKEVRQRLQMYLPDASPAATGPGRPKLGVVAREISLLPRHWEWLSAQPGGASATLRRLVDAARKTASPREQLKQAQESAYRFMTTMAGNLPHYEDAIRALYARDQEKFRTLTAGWPADIRHHSRRLAEPAFQ